MVSSGGVVGAAAAAAEAGVGVAKGPGVATSQSLKKGPWTAAEDSILMEYVKINGEGNWNAVQKNSGLMRCGKSCRLRWANHLRPNLKKGSFSQEEERIIIELHAKLGNKWARMAAQLPGRTDNEIKNYWNTRMKRRQRAGLPIYPQEVQEKAAAFHHQQVHQQHHKRLPHHNSSASLSSLLNTQSPTYNPSLFYNNLNFSSHPNHPLQNEAANTYYSNSNHFKLFSNSGNANTMSSGFSMPLTSSAPQYPPPAAMFNPNVQTQPPPFQSFKFDGGHTFEREMSFSSMIAGAPVDPIEHFVQGQESEIPSSHKPQPTTPSSGSSGGGGGACVMVAADNRVDFKTGPPKTASNISNSGLLDALVEESQNLSRSEQKHNSENGFLAGPAAAGVAAEKGKGLADYMSSEEGGVESVMKIGGEANADNQWEDLSSSQSSIGMKPSGEPVGEITSMDEDLLSLLNNFPLSVPLPEWYPAGSINISNASSSSITAGSNVESSNAQPNVPPSRPPPLPPQPPAVSSPEIQWNQFNSCSWDNMPGIC